MLSPDLDGAGRRHWVQSISKWFAFLMQFLPLQREAEEHVIRRFRSDFGRAVSGMTDLRVVCDRSSFQSAPSFGLRSGLRQLSPRWFVARFCISYLLSHKSYQMSDTVPAVGRPVEATMDEPFGMVAQSGVEYRVSRIRCPFNVAWMHSRYVLTDYMIPSETWSRPEWGGKLHLRMQRCRARRVLP